MTDTTERSGFVYMHNLLKQLLILLLCTVLIGTGFAIHIRYWSDRFRQVPAIEIFDHSNDLIGRITFLRPYRIFCLKFSFAESFKSEQ